MEYLFIVNPIAGAGYALKVMEQISSVLTERKIAFRSERTERQGDATPIAKAASGRPDRDWPLRVSELRPHSGRYRKRSDQSGRNSEGSTAGAGTAFARKPEKC